MVTISAATATLCMHNIILSAIFNTISSANSD